MDPQLIRAIESVGEPNWTAIAQVIAAFSAVLVGFAKICKYAKNAKNRGQNRGQK